MRKRDLFIAGIVICVGLSAFIKAWDYPAQSRMIPLIYSTALVLLSSIFGLRAIVTGDKKQDMDQEKEPLSKVFLVMGIILGYIASIQVLGFYSSTTLFLFLFMWIFRATPIYVSAGIALTTPGLIYCFFERMLHIPVPGGIFF
ncbi:MAG: tripartite tricarboxylate transporter TctB family protein [Synergistales bacterium]|nr:tripartite tricarboxylate transporter TctB family protein [Synergistales bacterium]